MTSQPHGDGDPRGTNGSGSGPSPEELTLSIKGVRARAGEEQGELEVQLDTSRGAITVFLHPCEGQTGCAVFLGGAGGGVKGPANGVYVRLASELVADGVSSVRVQYRQPGEFEECVLDALAACSFLKGIGAEQVVLVGHSFGGAVAVKAGELAPIATAVAALSSQRYGTQEVEVLGKPLLLIHGDHDEILDHAASEDIYQRAREPKRLVLLEGAGHGLLEAQEQVHDLLREFITDYARNALTGR
ncbi:MAG: alpha/beta hydrolase [Chloroflexi bacterium]|nr:alpha/beta hydrolase [Chloroflexota bacterium]